MLALLSFLSLFAIATSSSTNEQPRTFIVQVQHDSKPLIFPTHQQWYTSSLSSISPGTTPLLLHTYDTVFHGFSAKLSLTEALKLQTLPHIIAVIPERVRHVHTTRSPQFLGLKTNDGAGLLKESDFGSDLVIGVIDTGIWPERQSFNDRDLGPVPSRWKGVCASGKDFASSSCNRKLIGARYFCNGYEATNGKMNETTEYRSPRDSDGHGTHTASIAAGRKMYPVVYAGSSGGGDEYSSSLCLDGSLDPKLVEGKIVLCDRGINSRAAKGEVVKKAGGVGMILANGAFDGEGLVADCHVLPATAVGASGGDEIRRYMSSPPTATIVFRGTRVNVRPAPVVASFSARGPNPESPEILKPDDANSVYKVTIRPPGGTSVTVQPEMLVFRRVGQKLNFLVRVETTAVKLAPGASSMKSGSIIWADGKHTVTSPVVVTMQQPL
ncbi:hypothetical protein NC651_001722 [Populus alba x Populus x berolinensis]|nr:hypothetical protein NC651_001722 [Populus alba x Populus x berolinensis]